MKRVMQELCTLKSVLVGTMVLSVGIVTGCGNTGGPASPATPPPTTTTGILTGNWQGTLTSSSNTTATISGSIDQSGGQTSSGQFTTSVFHISGKCFVAVPDIPAQGFVQNTSVTLNSFSVNEQYVGLTGTADAAGDSITGTYSVNGGCDNNDSGNFSMDKYAPLTGTYAGSMTSPTANPPGSAQSVSLALTQDTFADGYGAFVTEGTATFGGISCFTTGNAMSDTVGKVIGNTINITFYTDDPSNGTVTVTGTFDTAAKTISNASYMVNGGNCAGATGTGTLTLQ